MRRQLARYLRLLSFLFLGLVLADGALVAAFAQGGPALRSKAADVDTILSNAQRNGYVRIIVLFESPVPASEIRPDAASVANVTAQNRAVQDAIIASHFSSVSTPSAAPGFVRGLVLFPVTPGFAVNVSERELESLAADPRVVRIQYDRADPPSLLQSVPLIGMTAAYTAGATGAGQAVAVLDTGVQSNHELLSGKLLAEACFSNAGGAGGRVTLCPNGTATQTGAGAASPIGQCFNGSTNLCLHGTHVAGIAAGLNTSQSAGEPTNGVAKNGSIFAIQVFTRFNAAGDCAPNAAPCVLSFTSDQISALNHVFANLTLSGGVKVASVNMSLGGGSNAGTCDGDARKSAIDSLRGAGVLTAIASGNDGSTSAIDAPGCISTAVTVGSTTKSDVVSSFSNMSSVVDLLAPGGFGGGSCAFGANNNDILGPVATFPLTTNSYGCLAGTSMATPHVAGAIAAIRTACPSATAAAIETALKNTGLSVTDNRPGGTQTKPRIRVDLAVKQLCAVEPPNDNFVNAAILGIGQTVAGTNVAATKEAGEPTHASVAGGRSVWWNLFASISGRITVNTAGSNYDTLLAVYTGNAVNALTAVASNDDCPATGTLQSCVTFNATAGTTYRIAVDGFFGDTGNIQLTATRPVVITDFNGDNRSDILWRYVDGSVAMWLMNGAQPIAQLGVTNNIPNEWRIIGVADFNGDNKHDFLWRYTDGSVAMWLMDGAQPIAQLGVTSSIPNAWRIIGSCDFNGDGRADILWRYTDGSIAMWLMNGAQPIAQLGVTNSIPNEWKIVGLGDFNGDGKCDFLWRYTDGSVAMWLMDGAQPIAQLGVTNSIPNAWQIIGVGDFSGDSKSDILWRYTDGAVAMWLMNGAQPIAQLGVTNSIPNEWKIVGIGDFNGDGNADFLWRYTDGSVAMWLMNGATPISQVGVTSSIPNEWKILGITTTLPVPAPPGPAS